jgi:hypothetical protein
MHHSSIRDHLSKCHPEKSHNSCEPGYVFNSAAVPEPELSQTYEKSSIKNFDIIDSINQTKLFSLNHSSNQVKKPRKLTKFKSYKNTLNSDVCCQIINNNINNCNLEELNSNKLKNLNKKNKTNEKLPKKITIINSISGKMKNNHDDVEDNSFDYDICNTNYENITKNENQNEIKFNILNDNKVDNLKKYENNLISSTINESANIFKNLDLTVSLASTSSAIQPIFLTNNSKNNEHQSDIIENYLQFSNLLSSFSQQTSNNPAISLNNLASTLIQRLSAASLMQNYDQTSKKTVIWPKNSEKILNELKDNFNNNSTFDQNTKDLELGFKESLKKQIENENESDFSKFRNEIDIKTKLLNTSECSDEYASSLSPSDTASTSDSLKSDYSKIFDNKNNELFKKSNISEQNNNVKKQSRNSFPTKRSNNKAISEVIQRLNMNLSSSSNTKEAIFDSKTEKNSNFSSLDKNDKISEKVQNIIIKISDENLEKIVKKDISGGKNSEFQKCSSAPVSPTFKYSCDTLESCYKCKFCNIIFNEYPLYSIHAGMHSNLNPWQCSACNHVCSDKIDFAFHILHLSKK